ncbi:Sigma-E factor regulatory protein rseB precursor [Serratia rubidaea]|uniref:Sigma-E factor regulatory protein rseB n=1 Tax=Serratia rubidaea TaxID=61652 RepID=A0A3S5DEZ8_SERRU|nr:Sigma-E factor regulatory protein rseB precursor [Serratia rubidaea]
MSSASRSLNYELAYISITKQGIESLRYRHALVEQQALGQLLHMDGPRREVLQRGDGISYFEPGLEPFTLSGDHIVDALPSIVYADFTRLAKYYDFISVGRTRISDRPCEVIRVVARDGSRYSYIVWMDEETKLPLRVDLLDRNGETLEQYRVISFTVGEEVQNALSGLLKASLPPLISLPALDNVKLGWDTAWLPAGVSEVARNRRKLPNVSVPVETRLYSDGLFSFSVNVSPAGSGVGTQLYRQGGGRFRPNCATAKRLPSSAKYRRQPPSVLLTVFPSGDRRNDERVGHGCFVATGRRAVALRAESGLRQL